MNYTFNNYEFEFIYNPDDLVISCHYHDKLWQDVFTIQEIKKQNFENIDNVNTFIDKCFNDHNINIQHSKEIKLEFINEHYKKLIFTLLPIRKNSSSNQEILDLKRELKNCKKYIENLERKFEEKFYIENDFYMNPDFNGVNIPYKFSGQLTFINSNQIDYDPDEILNGVKKKHINNFIPSCMNILKIFKDDQIRFDNNFSKTNISKITFINCSIDINSLKYLPETTNYVEFIACKLENINSKTKKYFPDTLQKLVISECNFKKTYENNYYINIDLCNIDTVIFEIFNNPNDIKSNIEYENIINFNVQENKDIRLKINFDKRGNPDKCDGNEMIDFTFERKIINSMRVLRDRNSFDIKFESNISNIMLYSAIIDCDKSKMINMLKKYNWVVFCNCDFIKDFYYNKNEIFSDVSNLVLSKCTFDKSFGCHDLRLDKIEYLIIDRCLAHTDKKKYSCDFIDFYINYHNPSIFTRGNNNNIKISKFIGSGKEIYGKSFICRGFDNNCPVDEDKRIGDTIESIPDNNDMLGFIKDFLLSSK
jgi:hypothetical protein